MEIGVIGTGNIGGTIARKLKGAGHHIRVANSRGRNGVQGFADEIGATAVDAQCRDSSYWYRQLAHPAEPP